MNDIERTLGMLIEQGKWNAKEIHEIKNIIKEINKKVEINSIFRLKMLGAILVMSFLASGLLEIARAFGGLR